MILSAFDLDRDGLFARVVLYLRYNVDMQRL